jgi:hypothetical protein
MGGLVALLVITALNVYKLRGLTPYGWRKQQEGAYSRGSDAVRRIAVVANAAAEHEQPCELAGRKWEGSASRWAASKAIFRVVVACADAVE